MVIRILCVLLFTGLLAWGQIDLTKQVKGVLPEDKVHADIARDSEIILGRGNLTTAGRVAYIVSNGTLTQGSLGWNETDKILQFGGTTSSYPALKRDGTGLQAKLADDSAYTDFTALDFQALGTGSIYWNGRTMMQSPADGNLLLKKNGSSDFGLLQFGGTTSSYPALKRNAATLEVKLADDSAGAILGAYGFNLNAPGALAWYGRSKISSSADGYLTLLNAAETDFGLLQFGGTTSSYPALKRNTTRIDFRLGDDSDYTSIYTRGYSLSSATASQQLGVQWYDQTTAKWFVGKNTDNSFQIYDNINAANRMTISTAGEIALIPNSALSVTGVVEVTGADARIKLVDDDETTSFTELDDVSPTQFQITKTTDTGAPLMDFNLKPLDGTSDATARFFRETDTTGTKRVIFHKGDGTSASSAQIGVDGTATFFQVLDQGAGTFEMPNGTEPTTDTTGELAMDTNGDGSTITTPVLQFNGNSTNYFACGFSAFPSSDNDVLVYDSATHTCKWEAQAGGSPGADSIGTSELDDDTDTAMVSHLVAIDSADNSRFEYLAVTNGVANDGDNLELDLSPLAEQSSPASTDLIVIEEASGGAIKKVQISNLPAGTPAADSVGTTALDDDSDTPLAGEWVQVDADDQAGFTYRTDAEALADLGIAYFQVTGPSAARTYTFPDSNQTMEWQANKNAASGYAGLTADTKLTTAQGQEVWSLHDLSNATENSPANDEVWQYVNDHWENQTLLEAGISATGHSHTIKRSFTYTLFDPTTELDEGDLDIPSIWVNRMGLTATITEVRCEIDAGSAAINLQRDDGSPANILSSNLDCSTAGATSTSFSGSEATISDTYRIDHVTASAATAKRMNITVTYTVSEQ